MKKLWLFLAFMLVFGASPLSAKEFVFTAIPDQDDSRLEERFGKVAAYLTKELGVKVKYIPVKSYSASVAAFKNNEVQLAWFGGLSGVKARIAVPGSKAIAFGESDTKSMTYIIANTSTGLVYSSDFPAGITGKTFTFGSKGSTAGRLMPEYFIRKHLGKGPEEAFKRVGFSGDHDKTLALVQSGSYQVGALYYRVWETANKEDRIDPKKVQVIWQTPTFPDYNWSIRGDVDKTFGKGFANKVKKALIGMKDKELLASFPRKSFIEANNDMFKPVLDTAREIGIIRK